MKGRSLLERLKLKKEDLERWQDIVRASQKLEIDLINIDKPRLFKQMGVDVIVSNYDDTIKMEVYIDGSRAWYQMFPFGTPPKDIWANVLGHVMKNFNR